MRTILQIGLFCACVVRQETFQWQCIPLRTASEKAKGHSGEFGQMCFKIAVSPSNPNHIAIGTGEVNEIECEPQDGVQVYVTFRGGIWVFDGKKWKRKGEKDGLAPDQFGALNFFYIAVDSTHPNIIYAGQNHCWRGIARGIFRSTDYGEHWENITGNLGPELTVWAITVSPYDGTVCLGTDYGNWKLSWGKEYFQTKSHRAQLDE